MYLTRLIAVAFLLTALTNAYELGSFNVTFDTPHLLQMTSDSNRTETLSGLNQTHSSMYSSDYSAAVAITEYENFTNCNAPPVKFRGCDLLTEAKRTVDGHQADLQLVDCDGTECIFAYWWHDDHTLVRLFTTMPWDHGALQLLKSFHMEEAKRE